MKNSIEKYRRAQKWSMERLGQAIGTDASTINKIEKGKINASAERMREIAAALGASVDDLLRADDDEGKPAVREHAPRFQPAQQLIPVMGSAAGSLLQGAFQLTEGPIEYIEPPPALVNSTGIYALYVDGLSMEPMFRHGTKIVVSEYRPPRIGDAVVVQERRSDHGPILASLGILDTRNGDKVILRKLNPVGKVEIQSDYVIAIHKVIDYSELLGA